MSEWIKIDRRTLPRDIRLEFWRAGVGISTGVYLTESAKLGDFVIIITPMAELKERLFHFSHWRPKSEGPKE